MRYRNSGPSVGVFRGERLWHRVPGSCPLVLCPLHSVLACALSAGQYLFDAPIGSGREFRIDVAGFVPPGI